MSSDYGPAIWIPSGHFRVGREGYLPKWIIMHGTAVGGTASDIGRFFQTNDPPTSTHYVVGRDGKVVQCVAEGDTAFGNGIVTEGHDFWWSTSISANPNLLTLSVEHVKPDPLNRDSITPAQQEASFALVKHLCERWDVPRRLADEDGGITGHFSVDPVRRSFCPGPYPWEDLIRFLQEEGA
jgi:N-acetyl-anhydromuramyl-L-alanine amidase AmpD